MTSRGGEPASGGRQFDVALYGATGFVGRLTARHLRAAGRVRVALAGRDRHELDALRDDLGVDWPVIVTDLHDQRSVAALARSTVALASTVGHHSLPLVLACAEAGTSYADLSGEVPFVCRSIAAAHDVARTTNARIVHGCGVNAVPSDLTTFLLARQALADEQGDLTDTTLIVESFKGGFSRGNLDSNQAQQAALRADPALRAAVADPWVLAGEAAAAVARDTDPIRVFRDDLTGRWLAPGLGGSFNSRLVRRSAVLNAIPYGRDFHYREGMGVGTSPLARVEAEALARGLALVELALTSRPARPVMQRLLPPGSGPSVRSQRNGRFRVSAHTRTSTSARYTADLAFAGDPGYSATSVMLGEAVLSLALDPVSSPGGVLTPATAMGQSLVDRLIEQHFTITVGLTRG